MPGTKPTRFLLLVYRVPQKPTSHRVHVWRMLKKSGAVYLQQSVCAFPHNAHVVKELQPILAKIGEAGGTYHVLPLRQLPPDEEQKLITEFNGQTARHYAEIVEDCEVNFVKEIEFETFRRNFTYEEAEEIRSDYEKIVAWLARVRARDWFGAPSQAEARAWVERCGTLLEDFERRVYEAQESGPEVAIAAPRRAGRRRVVPGQGGPAGEA